jgi:hypothetical protein
MQRGGSAQALPQLDARLLAGAAEAHRLVHHQLVGRLVEQQDPEHLVVDHALHDLGDAMEQLVQVEDRRRLLADLVQRRKQPGVPARLAIQRGVVDRDGDMAGQELERVLGVGREGRVVRALDVENADELVAAHQRDRQLGHDSGKERDVARVFGDVRHEDGHALLSRRAHDSLARADPEARRQRGVVAQHQRRPQAAVFLGQEDVEDAITDDAPQPVGDRGQQLVRLEHRVDVRDDREELGEQVARQQGGCPRGTQRPRHASTRPSPPRSHALHSAFRHGRAEAAAGDRGHQAHPAPSLPVPDGGPHPGVRGRQAAGRAQERVADERYFIAGPAGARCCRPRS